MKSIRTLAILALLILFPFISYVYLKRGYNFRLEVLQKLEPKGQLDLSECLDSFPDVLCKDDILGRTSVLYKYENEDQLNMLIPVFEEYSDRKEFQVLAIAKDSVQLETAEKKLLPWTLYYSDIELESSIALIDTAGNIRNYYEFDSTDFQQLGIHIPVVLTREKEKDIKMKKDK